MPADARLPAFLDPLYRQDYARAESLLRSEGKGNLPLLQLYLGVIHFTAFNDLGDTARFAAAEAAFRRAASADEKAAPAAPAAPPLPPAVVRALAHLQLGYVLQLKGREWQAALEAKKANALLRPLLESASPPVEARAAAAVLGYYKAAFLKKLAFIPFASGSPAEHRRRLEALVPHPSPLSMGFRTSLIWMHYDERRFPSGLALIEDFLRAYPANRAYRELKGDFLFRSGAYREALSLQEALTAEYDSLRRAWSRGERGFGGPGEIGYLRALGNRLKIHMALGETGRARSLLVLYRGKAAAPWRPWLPQSLEKEVSALAARLE